MPYEKIYDAFLSFNDKDKTAVEKIADWLINVEHLNIWIYTRNNIPGNSWQEEMAGH